MPNLETIILVTLAGLALSASPGPSMLYVLSRSVGQSTAAGLVSSIGLALGGVLLAVAAALGLAAVIAQSDALYNVVKYAGGLYLIYLGIQIWQETGTDEMEVSRVKNDSLSRVFYQGILVELLNPKTILFFLAFLPQFVDPEMGNITNQVLILGMLVPLTAIPSDIIVSFAGGSLAKKLSRRPKGAVYLGWLAVLVLVGLCFRMFCIS